MNPEFNFDGLEANYINCDRLSRTVRLVPLGHGMSASYGDILNGLSAAGLDPDEVQGIFKVSSFDRSYSVMLAYSDSVEKLIQKGVVTSGNCEYATMKMTEQIVSLRVHWLPVYYDNSIIYDIFSEFGKVMSVDMLKTAHREHVTLDGTREVKLKVDEFMKQNIPHIVNFKSGQKILITMAGRPPYCLKCKSIGHVRQRCPGTRTYAVAVNSDNKDGSSQGSGAPVPPVAQQSPVASSSGPVGPKGATEPPSGGASDSWAGGRGPEMHEMEMDPEKGQKRGREGQETPSETRSQMGTPEHEAWITPNKVAKSVPVPHGSLTPSKGPISTSNQFTPVMSVEDLMISNVK